MEQKRVTFKVAKAIKEAGYPQVGEYWYNGSGLCCYSESDLNTLDYWLAPYALDVWLWLWRKKGIYIQVERNRCILSFSWGDSCTFRIDSNPEEAIEAAIEYLIDNGLLK